MTSYLVFLCPRCGMARYAREGQKTAKCFRCSYLIPISSHRVKILLKTRRLEVARETIKRCKEKIGV